MQSTRTWKFWMTIALSTIFVAGCGEPDIQAMKPSGVKPAAEVILVNQPPNWSTGTVTSEASNAGVDVLVVQANNTNVYGVVEKVLQNRQIGMCMVVVKGPISNNLAMLPAQNPGTKFEFVSDGSENLQGANVKHVFLDKTSSSYCIGWLAGEVTRAYGQTAVPSTIGWVTGGTSGIGANELKSALAGAYSADPQASMIPISLGKGVTGLPHVLVASRPLTSAEWQVVNQFGSIVFSLVETGNLGVVGATPGFASMNAVQADFSSFGKGNWQSGDEPVRQSPFVSINTALVPATVVKAEAALESTVQGNPQLAMSAWSQVPAALQLLWAPIISAGK